MPDPSLVGLGLKAAETSLFKAVAEGFKGAAARSIGKFQSEFGVGFQSYVERNKKRCGLVKTLLHRIDPIEIDKAYVDPALEIRRQKKLGRDFPELLETARNVVIVGMGGSGKSVFLKRLFLTLCDNPFGRVPVFIELRDIKTAEPNRLLELLYQQWSDVVPSFTREGLESGLRSGKFTLLLDGLDEVDKAIRDEVSKQIIAFSYKYALCPIAVTSRPDEVRFASWNEFHTAKMLPFDLDRVERLIQKIEIDPTIKNNFLKELHKSLFDSHREFLSNPLLCTMMIMTYNEFEEIPSKMHIFYARAFDVLFTRHDKTKTFFNRQFYTQLAEDDFKKLFSAFCFVTYNSNLFSFEREKGIAAVTKAKELDSLGVASSDFLDDLHQSISILVKEGDVYSFLHRSFQEYFVAIFFADRQVEGLEKSFRKFLSDHRGDNVARLLFEINRDVFEKYFGKILGEFRRSLEKVDLDNFPAKALSMVIGSLMVTDKKLSGMALTEHYGLLNTLSSLYNMSSVREFLSPRNLFDDLIQAVIEESREDKKSFSIPIEEIDASFFASCGLQDALRVLLKDIKKLETELRKRDTQRKRAISSMMV